MNVKILETGERKSLVIRSENGIEWTQDLIGNAGALIDGQFTWSEDDEAYLVEQADYEWWSKYIDDTEATADEMTALAAKLDINVADIRDRVAEQTGSDYEQHRREAISTMQDIHDEHATSIAAATLGRRGGRSTSAAKIAAARENGRKGGRPRNQQELSMTAYETTLQCTAGSRTNPVHANVQFSGKLTSATALDAARRAFGHADGVTVTDSRDGTTYRCTDGKARKAKMDLEWMASEE